MDLHVNSRGIASVEIRGPFLGRLVGGYDLQFQLDMRVTPAPQSGAYMAILSGAEIRVRGASAGHQTLGFARFQVPMRVVQMANIGILQQAMSLPLLPSQIDAIEELRAAGDLDFSIVPRGETFFDQKIYAVVEEWFLRVPRSEWGGQLRNAGARDILLLEIPMYFGASSPGGQKVRTEFAAAERHFHNGEYLACVASCRRVLDALGEPTYGAEWVKTSWRNLTDRRTDMSKGEREGAIAATIRHYAQLAHHTENDGGETEYSRAEAKFVLSLTAALAARGS